MIQAQLSDDTITSASEEAFSLYEKSRWGEKKRSHIEYSSVEALALMQGNKLALFQQSKSIDIQALLKKIKHRDKNIETKLAVFADLRKKGYIVKTALKFGSEFRVYEKGVKPSQGHASWLLFPLREHETLTWYDFAAKNRVATSTNKKLLLAIVDDEGDVTYYVCQWFRS
ncbi:MAG: tRNA-intron lyase [Nanoarchaeota archaeon]|mgnify:CR=1 FL=1